MKWKHLFTNEMLRRGEEYKSEGRVYNLVRSGNQYSAKVRGTGYRLYDVTVRLSGTSVERMGCNCPYADSGRTCKHMAAVLYAIEAQEMGSVGTRETVWPFARSSRSEKQNDYRYFEMSRVASHLLIFDDTYHKAVRILESGHFEPQTVQTGYDYEGTLYCKFRGVYQEKKTAYPVEVEFDRNHVSDLRCGVHGCTSVHSGYDITRGQKEPCVHTLALLLYADQFLQTHDVGDSTDLTATHLLDSFRKNRSSIGAAKAVGREVTLEPRVIKDKEQLKLSFKIGCDKLYIVRNLTELVECIESRGEISFGKLTLNFAQDKIREEDRELYFFIKNVIDDQNHHNEMVKRQNYYYSVRELAIKADFVLFGQRLDTFFDMEDGRSVPYCEKDAGSNARSAGLLRFGHESPKITLRIAKDINRDGVFDGVKVSGTAPQFFRTPRSYYFLHDSVLSRVDETVQGGAAPLYHFIKNGEIAFRIGRQSLSEFYYTVLPQLREYVDIQEDDADTIETFLPPEVQFAFYLDMVGGVPVCRAVSQYGEMNRSTMDCLDTRSVKEGFRDMFRESQAAEVVQQYFPQVDRENDQFVCAQDEDAVYDLLNNGIAALSELGDVQGTERFRALRIRPKIQVKVGVSVSGDLMNLEIGSTDVSRDELLEILRSYKQKKRYHRLKSGDFVNIEDDIAELSAMVDTMHLSAKDILNGSVRIPSYRALYIDNMSKECEALDIKRDKYFKKIIQGFKTVNESDFEVPESLQEIMRGYQVYGHKWLRTLEAYGFGGILADDMGLGKTLQMISVFAAAKAEGREGTSMVICPSSLVYNWQAELTRFAPELSNLVIAGTQKERAELIECCDTYDVVVTSYDLFKRDVELYEGKEFLYQVIDEAQYIKTHTTAAAKSVKLLHSKTRFALTGTPIENRLSELWSIFDYLMPGFLYGYETFRKEFEAPIAKKSDEEATRRLKRMVSPFILRRLKTDVLKDLPDKIEEVRYAKFARQQQLVYDSQVVSMKQMVDAQDEASVKKNKLQILAELTKIRQICCDPSLLLEDYKGESAKRETCMDLINSAIEGEHRILLFSQFTSMLELLEQDLKAAGIDYFKITGSTPKKERMDLVQRFNAGEMPVFLISLKAGGTGLNLTGADVVIHYDPWWNVAAQNQATDRAHRIGQTRTVSVYRIIVKDSIEEKILRLQELKKNLADEILTGGTGSIAEMSKEDLLELLS